MLQSPGWVSAAGGGCITRRLQLTLHNKARFLPGAAPPPFPPVTPMGWDGVPVFCVGLGRILQQEGDSGLSRNGRAAAAITAWRLKWVMLCGCNGD